MKEVIIYSTPTCVHCKHAKEFFKNNKIDFVEYDVLNNVEKRTEMVEKSGQMGVPVISVGEDVIVGYDEEMLKDLLEVQ